MSETPAGIATDFAVGVQTEVSVPQIKKDLFDPKTISKNNDQEGRDKLAAELREKRRESDALHQDMANTQTELDDRQSNLLVKLKTKLNIPDKQTQELEVVKLEQGLKDENLPDTRKMVDAYYEKVAETPLTNQEKRDLLKPEVLAQLSTDEYIALWKRLNPHFLTHVTRQGFRDHNAMLYHSAGLQEFHDGLLNIVKDEKQLRPPLVLGGLKARDEVSVKMFLSEWALQAENEEEATKRFDSQLHESLASAPKYPDKTAVHFAAQLVADDHYGGEKRNEAFFAFPSDVIASQYNFAFNGRDKDFIHPQNETNWNDVFIWPNKENGNGISVDSGLVFLPEFTPVDPTTGSKYASEIKMIDGREKRVMTEDKDLTEKFITWANSLDENSDVIKRRRELSEERDYFKQQGMNSSYDSFCLQEIEQLGFSEDAALQLIDSFQSKIYMKTIGGGANFEELIKGSSARFKRAENTVTAKEYWEDYFSKNPELRPKHIIYYDGDPTNAVYKFQQENNIGSADTSKVDGQLLGFDDHHVTDMTNDPRANVGHQELVDLGKKIIADHYRNKIL